jgi:hypothetical protein
MKSREVKRVHLDRVEIKNLSDIPCENLEYLCLRKVMGQGVRDIGDYIKGCKNLREFSCCCSDRRVRNILDLGVHVGLFPPAEGTKLRRLALGKTELSCTIPITGRLDNPIEELYLDNCKLADELIDNFPLVFPNLKKVKLCRNVNVKLLSKILQIPSIDYIVIWGLALGSQQTQINIDMKSFLERAGFDKQWRDKTKKEKTFMLQKVRVDEVGSRPNDGQNVPTYEWKGTKVTDRYREFTKMDYEHFSWGPPYKDYDFFYKLGD